MDRDRPLNSPATPGRIGRIVVRGEFGRLLSAANRGSANVDLADFAARRGPKTIPGHLSSCAIDHYSPPPGDARLDGGWQSSIREARRGPVQCTTKEGRQ
jgi:hypothetical protein